VKRRRDRLDEYVRQALPLDEERTVALGDAVARHALFEEIISVHVADPVVSPDLPRRRRRYALAIAAGVVVASAITATVVLNSDRQRPTAAPNPTQSASSTQSPQQASPTGRQGDIFESGQVASCVESYSPQTLARRGFAFDGTVVSIGKPPSTAEGADPYVPVLFHVNRWFRAGHGDQVTVGMFPPGLTTSVANAAYGIGSRLLVSGGARYGGAALNDPISWACGFTRWYTEADAHVWERAFR
jgi:hypothetical protein